MQNIYELDLLHLTDGKLRTDDGCAFNIHKMVLSTKSNYFLRLFCGPLGKDRSDFLIPGIRGEILYSILSFIYTSAVDISERNVYEILVAADYLLCDDVINHIKDVYMRDSLSASNSLPLYLAALIINQNDILCACYRFIQTHFEEVVSIDDSEIGELPLEALQQFLGDKKLRVRDENAVWVAIAKWVQADFIHRQSLVLDLLLYLTVSDVDEELSKRILEHKIVACNPFCRNLNALKRWSMFNVYKLLDRIWGCFNINIFRQYIQNHPKPISHSFSYRIPEYFHFILERRTKKPRTGVDFYVHVTYDESFDMWREIFKVPFEPLVRNLRFHLLQCIGDNIYLLLQHQHIIHRFNLSSRTWIPMPQFSGSSVRFGYGVAQLRGLIYVFGGISSSGDERGVSTAVEVYDPDKDMWYQVTPMKRVWPFKAITLGNKIYVIAAPPILMTVQSYDSESNTWTALNTPSGRYFNFQTFTYRGRLFVMGKSNRDDEFINSIEAFDPAIDEWTAHKDLPYGFLLPKALVVNNELIVYESDMIEIFEPNPAVLWNEEFQYWDVVKESNHTNMLQKFNFITQDTGGSMNGILKENKDTAIQFLNSPFN